MPNETLPNFFCSNSDTNCKNVATEFNKNHQEEKEVSVLIQSLFLEPILSSHEVKIALSVFFFSLLATSRTGIRPNNDIFNTILESVTSWNIIKNNDSSCTLERMLISCLINTLTKLLWVHKKDVARERDKPRFIICNLLVVKVTANKHTNQCFYWLFHGDFK